MGSIAERIAALKLQQAGNDIPVGPPPGVSINGTSTPAAQKSRPPPPPRPSLPARPDRNQTLSVPPGNDRAPSNGRSIGNQPERPSPTNGPTRPPLPTRTTGQGSQQSSGLIPTLPPRRPSDIHSETVPDLSRRGSTDSQSSIATAKSSVSAISNATSRTSQGDRNRIKAPEFDASTLPSLPPRRTQAEKEAADRKYGNVRVSHPLRHSKSTPKVAQVQEETTPPPLPPVSRQVVAPPPVLPARTNGALDNRPQTVQPEPRPPVQPPRPRPSALTMGFGTKTSSSTRPPPVAARPDAVVNHNDAPPPIPASSKPDLSAIMALKPKPSQNQSNGIVPTAAPSNAGPVAISSFLQFNDILSSNTIVVSDFYADWCGPCRNFAPDYERLSKEYSRAGQISFVKINTDHNPDLRDTYKIKAWPTLIIFERGTQVQLYQGAHEYGITSTVEDLARKAGIDLYAPAAATPAPDRASSTSGMTTGQSQSGCLLCRDFSAPDAHAARFPRESLPSQDLGWLAQQLTSPFPSLTDKARALFTWLHHNVAYNTEAFFANNVQPSTPQSTLATGLAVCEGYAGLFAALALKVGLEAFVVGGASKGYGYTQIRPGDPIPPFKSDHAWNIIRIDNGKWKLIDTCWGAGNVDRAKGYTKAFNPMRFTQPNNDFGLDHFPEDASKQYRTDGRTMSWEEFQRGNKNGTACDVYGMASDEGFAPPSFQPLANPILTAQLPGPTVRFAFQKKCPHWDPVKNGKGQHYLYLLAIDKPGGGGTDLAAEFDTTGDVWWCDVPTSALRPGTKIQIMALTKFDNRDGRGLTKQEYLRKKGRVGWSGGYLCKWTVE